MNHINFKNPYFIIALSVLITVVLLPGLFNLKMDGDTEKLLSIKHHSYKISNYIKETFGNRGKSLIVAFNSKNIFSSDNLQKISKLTELFEEQEWVAEVRSIANTEYVKNYQGSIVAEKLMNDDEDGNTVVPKSSKEIDQFIKNLYSEPLFNGNLYSYTRKGDRPEAFGMIITLNDESEQTIEDSSIRAEEILSEVYKTDEFLLFGMPYIQKEVAMNNQKDLKKFLPLIFLIMIIVFAFNFRSIRGVGLTILGLILVEIWTLGLMGLIGIKLSVIGIMLPVIIMAVGSSYGIHLLNEYYHDLGILRNKNLKEGIPYVLSRIRKTILFSGLTTFIGFASLQTSAITIIREFGVFTCLSIVFSLYVFLYLMPSILQLLPYEIKHKQDYSFKNDWLSKLVKRLSRFVVMRYKYIAVFFIIVVCLAVYLSFDLRFEASALKMFKKGSDIWKKGSYFSKNFGGYQTFEITLDTKNPEGAYESEALILADKIKKYMLTLPAVGNVTCLPDMVKSMHKQYNFGKQEYYKIPDNSNTIKEYFEVFGGIDDNGDGVPDQMETYVDMDYSMLRILVRLKDLGPEEPYSSGWTERIEKQARIYIKSILPVKYKFYITGDSINFKNTQKYIITSQFLSIIISLIAIFFVVYFMFKSFRISLFSLIPLSCSVLFNFAIMAVTGIEVNIATAMIASVVIGIGIDDTLHFIINFMHQNGKPHTIGEVIEKTIQKTGKPIIYTSLALILGFGILLTSSFSSIFNFGLLIGLTFINTTIGALVVLPVIILVTTNNKCLINVKEVLHVKK